MLLITRPKDEFESLARANSSSGVVFIACEGAQDAEMGRRLEEAFRRGGAHETRWLRFEAAAGKGVWLQGDGWALTSEV